MAQTSSIPMILLPATVSLVFVTSCSRNPIVVAPEEAYDRAVEFSNVSDEDSAMEALRVALRTDAEAYQRALLEPAFHEGLRDTDAFRKAMHDAAVEHRVSRLTLVGSSEPGEWIEIEGRTIGPADTPVADAVVRVFITDARGRYHPRIEGDDTPRIFGTLVSDDDGNFTFRSVRPGPYPGTRDAIHIHISAQAGSMRLAAPHYAVFDDDPLLLEPQNAEQRGEAIRVRMEEREGDGVTRGTITLPMR